MNVTPIDEKLPNGAIVQAASLSTDGNTVVYLGYWPHANEYITWVCPSNDPHGTSWGHYFTLRSDAQVDFNERACRYLNG